MPITYSIPTSKACMFFAALFQHHNPSPACAGAFRRCIRIRFERGSAGGIHAWFIAPQLGYRSGVSVLHLTQFSFGTVAHRKAKSTRNQCCGIALVNTAESQVNWLLDQNTQRMSKCKHRTCYVLWMAVVSTATPLILTQTHPQQVSLCRPTKQNQHNYLALRVIMTFDVAQIEVMP
jgi:hypothetical protein